VTSPPVLTVRTDDPTPPYEQLRLQLAELITSGVLPPGQRLPPLRQLAADLNLAVGTAARAYRELESAGLVRSRRGGGTTVAEPRPGASRGPSTLLREHASGYVRRARLLGVDDDAILDAVRAACRAQPPGPAAGPAAASGSGTVHGTA